ncbi:MAG: SDR family oxidoreductase, partial [Clostridia bacterium]|nr:SDR family oxidoreductase [Clostridia bacterium]
IDVAANFAGGAETRIHKTGSLEFCDIPIEVFDWGLDVNLRAQIYMAHAVMKQMREQKSGVIVNIGSITGIEGSDRAISYASSKSAAAFGLTKSLALAGAPYNVRCVCVSPGPVLTRPEMAKMATLAGRAADPDEIIDMVLYLASDKGAFINGTNILIDGGRYVMHKKSYGKKEEQK